MLDAQPKTTQLSEYTEPNFWVETTELTFDLQPESTLVSARLQLMRNPNRPANSPLELDGNELELISVAINGKQLSVNDYSLDDESLVIHNMPDQEIGRASCRKECISRVQATHEVEDPVQS